MCLSARCVLVCCCTAGTCAQLHLAGTVLPTPVHGHTGSSGPTAPCVLCCTISTLCAVPHCLVLCSALHCVCLAALHLLAVGSGQWNFCYALPHRLGAVGSATPAKHCLTACGQWAVGSGTSAMHCHIASGRWAVQFLQCAGPSAGGTGSLVQEAVAASRAVLMPCTASLPGDVGQCGAVWGGVGRCGLPQGSLVKQCLG